MIRPVEVDSDQIDILVRNNQGYTTQDIDNILKVSKSINLLVKMKNASIILQEKNNKKNGPFGQPNTETTECLICATPGAELCIPIFLSASPEEGSWVPKSPRKPWRKGEGRCKWWHF